MNHLSVALAPRFLGVLLAVLLALLLLTALVLVRAHVGAAPTLAGSTEAILE